MYRLIIIVLTYLLTLACVHNPFADGWYRPITQEDITGRYDIKWGDRLNANRSNDLFKDLEYSDLPASIESFTDHGCSANYPIEIGHLGFAFLSATNNDQQPIFKSGCWYLDRQGFELTVVWSNGTNGVYIKINREVPDDYIGMSYTFDKNRSVAYRYVSIKKIP